MTRVDDAVAATLADPGTVVSTFQPIVDLDSRSTVAYEALARWPSFPDVAPEDVFAAAHRGGQLHRLEWACRTAALGGAFEAGLDDGHTLFVNVEPGLGRELFPPDRLSSTLIDRARAKLRIVIEVTERSLLADPAALLETAAWARALGFGIALDDVGANSETLALLPFIAPDVVKLDPTLIETTPSAEAAVAITTVLEYAERSGARILAEGIENETSLEQAVALGASLGQGWLFGRPGRCVSGAGAVDNGAADTSAAIPFLPAPMTPTVPSALFGDTLPYRTIRPGLLASLSRAIELQALESDVPLTVLASFQAADRFTGPDRAQYDALAAKHPFVALLGPHPSEQTPRFLTVALDPAEAFASEWTLVVVGPHRAVALIAREVDADEGSRRFDYALTHDRELAVAAGRSLIARILPGEAHHSSSPEVAAQ